MSRSAIRARPGQDRTSLYQEITDKIIAELQAGRIPWVQPWETAAAKAPLAMPQNASTRRRYSGINVLILWGTVIERSFSGQSWLTFRQALGLGGNVRKGERGTTVVYADRFVPNDERRCAAETGDEAQAIPFLKRFTVFNTDQCEGLLGDVASVAPAPPPGLIEPQAEALIAATGAEFRIGGARYQLASHGLSRTIALEWSNLQTWPGPQRVLRLQILRARRIGRRNGGRVHLRVARHSADRALCRLHWLLARASSRGQSRDRPRCE